MKGLLIFSLLLSYNILSAQTIQNPVFYGNPQIGPHNVQNNYNDPDYIPDSINFVTVVIPDSVDATKDRLAVYPQKGAWANTFLVFPRELIKINDIMAVFWYCYGGTAIMGNSGGTAAIIYKGKKYEVSVNTSNLSSSKINPVCMPFPNRKSFFIFGEYSDMNKWYVYDFGKVYWLNGDKNFLRR